MGKSRVAPLKPVTIPRMELTAAVVGVNLVKFLRNKIDLELESVTIWTDSTSVLQYINNTAGPDGRCFHEAWAVSKSVH